jgi:cell division protein FtsL
MSSGSSNSSSNGGASIGSALVSGAVAIAKAKATAVAAQVSAPPPAKGTVQQVQLTKGGFSISTTMLVIIVAVAGLIIYKARKG